MSAVNYNTPWFLYWLIELQMTLHNQSDQQFVQRKGKRKRKGSKGNLFFNVQKKE